MFLILNIFLAALPTFILLGFIYRMDSQKKEPKRLVLKLFLFGCLSTIPAVIAEYIVGLFEPMIPPYLYLFFNAFIVAGLCEESIKLGTVYLFAYRRPEFDEITDGVVYTVAAGMGFAFLENIVYSIGRDQYIMILIIRGITSVPLHAVCSGIMGYFIGMSKFRPGKSFVLGGLLLAVFIHGLYDYLLFIEKAYLSLLIIPLLILSFLYLIRLIKKGKEWDRMEGRS